MTAGPMEVELARDFASNRRAVIPALPPALSLRLSRFILDSIEAENAT